MWWLGEREREKEEEKENAEEGVWGRENVHSYNFVSFASDAKVPVSNCVMALSHRDLTWKKRCGKLCGRETKGCARCVFVGAFVGCAFVRVRADACAWGVSQTCVVCVHDHNIDPQQRQGRWPK